MSNDARVSIDELVAQAYDELSRGRFDAAVLWSRVLVGAFSSAEGVRLLAVSAHLAGDLELAAETYPKALERFANDLYLIAGFAELCLDLGRFDEAADWLKRAIEADPTASHPAGARARLLVAKHKRKYGL